jgi:hypothetical protein
VNEPFRQATAAATFPSAWASILGAPSALVLSSSQERHVTSSPSRELPLDLHQARYSASGRSWKWCAACGSAAQMICFYEYWPIDWFAKYTSDVIGIDQSSMNLNFFSLKLQPNIGFLISLLQPIIDVDPKVITVGVKEKSNSCVFSWSKLSKLALKFHWYACSRSPARWSGSHHPVRDC